MPLLAINYHHVGVSKSVTKSMNGIFIDDFLNHIEFLRKHFYLIGLNEVEKMNSKQKGQNPLFFRTSDHVPPM